MSMPMSSPDAPPRDGLVPLEAVLCTEELKGRPTRRPDYETENRALAVLIQALADSPQTILQKLADTMLEVFQCDSAGLSLVAKDGKTFYWPAIAGAWRPHAGGGTPRDFGPCGDVLDRDAPLLFKHFERRYPYLQQATPAAEEALLVPFYVEGKAAGTIWAMAHDDRRRFDAEDLRQMESLGRFAAAAYQAANAQQLQEARRAALNLMEEAVQSRQSMEQLNRGLRESEERYRTLYAALPVAAFVCDRKAVIQNYNNRAVELWGREPKIGVEQHCGSTKLILPDGTLLPHSQSPMVEVLRTGVPARNVEVFIERPDGTRLFVVVNFVALKDAQGEIVGVVTSFDDITERKQAEADFREIADRFRFMAESMPQKIFTATPEGNVNYFNAQWMEFTGLSFEQIRDWGWTQLIHPEDVEENVRDWQRSIDTGEPFQLVHRCRSAKGEYRWHLSRAQAMRDANGRISMWIGSNTDIHEEKETEAALLQSEEALRSLNEDLKHFSYAASHDLQEPLRMVMSYTQLLAREYRGRLDPQADHYIAFAVEGAQRMEILLRDLREYWSVNEQKIEHPVPIDCNRVLEQTLGFLAVQIQETGGVLTHDPLPVVMAEDIPLLLLFQNLIGNALKYHRPDAPPRIHVSAQRSSARAWSLSVADNGIGIDFEHLGSIFAPFKRLHGRDVPGSGLGLAICQKIVERYGGRIWVESAYGQGSVFYFTLPEQGGEI